MSFRAEPPYRHGSAERVGVLLVNLGTPDAPTAPALRRYLAEFLSDPRVVEIPRIAWWPILHGIILRTRPARSAAKYATVWTDEGSPLAVWTRRQAEALQAALGGRGHDLIVRPAMRYGRPAIPSVLDELRAEGVTRVLVLPMYPQYAAATTASVGDKVMQWARQARRVPELRFVGEWHDDPGYIAALAERVREHWAAHGRAERLVLSFHGVPHRSLLLGDPYHCQCHKTARLLGEALALPAGAMTVTFQSRFGKARWLEPYTEPTLVALAGQGVKRVDVVCPGFVADCLETLEEIAQEARAAFLGAGGQDFRYVDCLNARPAFIEALAAIALQHLQGWPTAADAGADAAARAARRERALAMGAAD
jgi:protoporphyrin/coproporphyrin ferrochelatase